MGNSLTGPFWRDSDYLEEQKAGLELIDAILEPYRPQMKGDYQAYRNHCVRVYNFALYLMKKPSNPRDDIKKIAIALAFHDLGIWTDNTVDYIDPSRKLAKDYLIKENLSSNWGEEIDLMIAAHHQILQGSLPNDSLAEIIRRADLVDFSWGFVRNGLPKEIIQKVQGAYANAGFHWRLMQLASGWFIHHPTNPAPMLRWSN